MGRRIQARGGDGMVAAAPRRRGAADQAVYRALVEAITDHRLPPGTPLPEDRLAAAFGYSRSVIRQALQLAAHDGLAEQRPNHTAAVARPAFEEARDVFAARMMLEVPLVAEAARRADRRDLARLKDNLAAEQAAIEAGDRHRQLRLSGEFHRLIAALAGNRVMVRFVGHLVSRSALILALYEPAGHPSCSAAEHAALLGAIAANDPEAAEAHMSRHLAHLAAGLTPAPEPRTIDFRALFAARTEAAPSPGSKARVARTPSTRPARERA